MEQPERSQYLEASSSSALPAHHNLALPTPGQSLLSPSGSTYKIQGLGQALLWKQKLVLNQHRAASSVQLFFLTALVHLLGAFLTTHRAVF